ncbi:ATP-dependent 6-phosphofructokinase [Oceanobacillus chungangensis]|uniref:6-phosphofructokinase n=1 Tax=Oceanobacillus chungangensis TaxID=1229152 RepID=A0A3D8PY51_9BACI|nr:ATP-dependent 6-phosphofructokinase [Oceanobacillus chungangensis]RDW20702.1 ATP-dependent 6-phosphofructokinase [Oceanobacillus chungangensis]
MSKLGIMTSGGDAPGMNAAINAVVKAANYYELEVMAIQYGFQGLIDGEIYPLDSNEFENITDKGGTILKTSNSRHFNEAIEEKKALNALNKYDISTLVIIGGEGSFKAANTLHQQGVKVIGIPATIENNFAYTEYAIGFDTTVNTILESIARIKDTNLSHDKTSIVEVMGQNCGDLALYSALAGGGEIISTPENKLDLDAICAKLSTRISNGRRDNLIIVSENLHDIDELQKGIEETLDISVRTSVLGLLQRGGHPSAFDRRIASRMGVAAVELLKDGHSGKAVGIRDNKIINVDFSDVHTKVKDKQENYRLAEILSR